MIRLRSHFPITKQGSHHDGPKAAVLEKKDQPISHVWSIAPGRKDGLAAGDDGVRLRDGPPPGKDRQ